MTRADRIYATLSHQRHVAMLIGYHRIVADFDRESSYAFPSMLISCAMFERHLDWVARRFQVVSLDELRNRVESPSRTSRPVTAITFDDGYRDVYEHAFPLLMRKGIPAAVFVTTDYVGTSGVLPHDQLYLLLSRAVHRWRSFAQTLAGVLRRLEIPTPVVEASGALPSPHAALRALVTALSERDLLADHSSARSRLWHGRRDSERLPSVDLGDGRRNEPRRHRHRLTHQTARPADERESDNGRRGDGGVPADPDGASWPAGELFRISRRTI